MFHSNPITWKIIGVTRISQFRQIFLENLQETFYLRSLVTFFVLYKDLQRFGSFAIQNVQPDQIFLLTFPLNFKCLSDSLFFAFEQKFHESKLGLSNHGKQSSKLVKMCFYVVYDSSQNLGLDAPGSFINHNGKQIKS